MKKKRGKKHLYKQRRRKGAAGTAKFLNNCETFSKTFQMSIKMQALKKRNKKEK